MHFALKIALGFAVWILPALNWAAAPQDLSFQPIQRAWVTFSSECVPHTTRSELFNNLSFKPNPAALLSQTLRVPPSLKLKINQSAKIADTLHSLLSVGLAERLTMNLGPQWKPMLETWGAGPSARLLGQWFLATNVRVEGAASTGVRCLILEESEKLAEIEGLSPSAKFLKYGALRPTADISLGMGWNLSAWDVFLNYELKRLWKKNIFSSIAQENYFTDPKAPNKNRSAYDLKLTMQRSF